MHNDTTDRAARVSRASIFALAVKLCRCERGEVYSASAILLTTIIAIGGVVGLTSYRDQVVQELGDFSAALTHLDQSYSTPYGQYVDDGPSLADPPNAAPSGMTFGP